MRGASRARSGSWTSSATRDLGLPARVNGLWCLGQLRRPGSSIRRKTRAERLKDDDH